MRSRSSPHPNLFLCPPPSPPLSRGFFRVLFFFPFENPVASKGRITLKMFPNQFRRLFSREFDTPERETLESPLSPRIPDFPQFHRAVLSGLGGLEGSFSPTPKRRFQYFEGWDCRSGARLRTAHTTRIEETQFPPPDPRRAWKSKVVVNMY